MKEILARLAEAYRTLKMRVDPHATAHELDLLGMHVHDIAVEAIHVLHAGYEGLVERIKAIEERPVAAPTSTELVIADADLLDAAVAKAVAEATAALRQDHEAALVRIVALENALPAGMQNLGEQILTVEKKADEALARVVGLAERPLGEPTGGTVVVAVTTEASAASPVAAASEDVKDQAAP